jgi:GNAT superfamily N-acetyltransferase
MSLYGKYIEERLDWNIIEKDYGFIVWSEHKDHFIIEEIFVLAEERSKGYARDLIGEVEAHAIMNKVPYLIGSVWPHTKGSTETVHAMIKIGCKLMSADGGRILLQKKVY